MELPYRWGFAGTEIVVGADFVLALEQDHLGVVTYVRAPLLKG